MHLLLYISFTYRVLFSRLEDGLLIDKRSFLKRHVVICPRTHHIDYLEPQLGCNYKLETKVKRITKWDITVEEIGNRLEAKILVLDNTPFVPTISLHFPILDVPLNSLHF